MIYIHIYIISFLVPFIACGAQKVGTVYTSVLTGKWPELA